MCGDQNSEGIENLIEGNQHIWYLYVQVLNCQVLQYIPVGNGIPKDCS